MNYYLTAIEGMPTLIDCCNGDVMHFFTKKTYVDSFKSMYQKYFPVLDALEKGYKTVIDKDQYLTNMADALTEHAAEQVKACKGRGKRDQMRMDLNMTMAVYVLPMVTEFKGETSQPLTQKLIESWKRAFPKTTLQASDYKTIEEGFHKKYCYITTAACETLGMEDDCYEMNLLRGYRDSYLMESPDGEKLIEEYYDVAPSIVKHISQQPDADQIYRSIWEEWVQPCIDMIETDQLDACRDHYIAMVQTLQAKYFYQNPVSALPQNP